MEYETLLVEKQAPVYIITMNRPDRMNGFIPQIAEDLVRAIDVAAQDPEVRVLILTGADPAFTAGADLKAPRDVSKETTNANRLTVYDYQRPIWSLLNLPKPTIAAVNGVAAGGGSHLALACDIRIGSERARFSEAFVRISLVPDLGGGYLLHKLVGPAAARDLILTGRIIDAREAQDLGLLSRIVPHEKLMDSARALAHQIAEIPAHTLATSKQLIYRRLMPDLLIECESEAGSQAICRGTQDNREAVKAFVEKRKPSFEGR